jgi:hypothetical protein
MKTQTPFKRLILRAALRKVSPMVIRVLAVPDCLDLAGFDEDFRSVLAWDGLGFSCHVHGQELTSFFRRGKVIGKPCGNFNCAPERHFSIPAEALMIGNGSFGFSTPRWECHFSYISRLGDPVSPRHSAICKTTHELFLYRWTFSYIGRPRDTDVGKLLGLILLSHSRILWGDP